MKATANTIMVLLTVFAPFAYSDITSIGGLRVMSADYTHFLIVFLQSAEGVVLGHLYTLDGNHIAELSWFNLIGNIVQTLFYEELPNINFQLIEELSPQCLQFQ